MNFECYIPGKVIFGSGRIKELPEHARNLGSKAFITSSLKGIKVLGTGGVTYPE